MADDYERERQARIAANKAAMLAAMGNLDTEAPAAASTHKPSKPTSLGAPAKPKKSAAPKPKREPKPKAEPAVATRRQPSRRHAAVTLKETEEERAERIKQEEEEREEEERVRKEERQARRRRKHADRALDALELSEFGSTPGLRDALASLAEDSKGAATGTSRASAATTSRDVKSESPPSKVDETEAEEEEEEEQKPRRRSSPRKPPTPAPAPKRQRTVPTKSESDEKALDDLEADIASLALRAITKIVPSRIYSLSYHPTETQDIIFAGDKEGHIGLWNATNASKQQGGWRADDELSDDVQLDSDDAADETWFGPKWHWKAHEGSVSALRFNPVQSSQLLSSSYDGTIRVTDIEAAKSYEVLDADAESEEEAEDMLIGGFDLTQDGNVIWACDNDGGVIRRDLREKKESMQRWWIDVDKIGTISLNPADNRFGSVSHRKRLMSILDLRQLADCRNGASKEGTRHAVVAEYPHGKAVSSAYFDRTGSQVLTTSYDDQLRVFDFDTTAASTRRKGSAKSEPATIAPSVSFKHNCQTGRYVSVFKASWATCPTLPSHFTVGHMNRFIDIYSPERGFIGRLSQPSYLTAVPAVTASHPRLPSRYVAGNASGKVCFFGRRRLDRDGPEGQ